MHFIDRSQSQRVYFYKIDIALPVSVLQAVALVNRAATSRYSGTTRRIMRTTVSAAVHAGFPPNWLFKCEHAMCSIGAFISAKTRLNGMLCLPSVRTLVAWNEHCGATKVDGVTVFFRYFISHRPVKDEDLFKLSSRHHSHPHRLPSSFVQCSL